MDASREDARQEDIGVSRQVNDGSEFDEQETYYEDYDQSKDRDNKNRGDISEQIGKALENFAPFFLTKMEETIDRAVSTRVAIAVEEEFNRRFPKNPETTPKQNEINPSLGSTILAPKPKEDYDYKNFTICKPPTFDGTPDPIVSARWLSEIEGTFRTSRCPHEFRTIYGTSMLRNTAKRW